MKKLFLSSILFCVFASFSFGQFSINAGPSFIKPFGIKKIYPGLNFGFELSNDDVQTIYARFTFAPARIGDSISTSAVAYDFNTNPYQIQVMGVEKYNYSMLEFGKRYYFGDGYEAGFGIYGGSSMSLIFNKVTYRLDDYDKTTYQSSFDEGTSNSIVSLAFGLDGGVKYSMHFGTIFFDAGINYALFGLQSNSSAPTNSYSNLLFNINLGIRKDFY